ncbi:hypothetical protein EJB05_53967, partial [Eragrostis curvula]
MAKLGQGRDEGCVSSSLAHLRLFTVASKVAGFSNKMKQRGTAFVGTTTSSTTAIRRPLQFLAMLTQEFMEKLLEMNQPHVFFTGRCSQYLASHGITNPHHTTLLLKYEGQNMVFRVHVFDLDGFRRASKHTETVLEKISNLPDVGEKQGASIQKSNNILPTNEEQENLEGCMDSSKKASSRKKLNANTLKKELSLAKTFCDAIQLQGPCIITLRTSTNNTGWQSSHDIFDRIGRSGMRSLVFATAILLWGPDPRKLPRIRMPRSPSVLPPHCVPPPSFAVRTTRRGD